MADVNTALRSVASVFAQPLGTLQSLSAKQELLSSLMENEQMRLVVWLYPLDHERRHLFFSGNSGKTPTEVSHDWKLLQPLIKASDRLLQATLSAALKTAWAENPRLAVQLASRFASPKLANEVRSLLLRHPERAIDEPDALQILIGASLPTDMSFQLKVSHAIASSAVIDD